MRGIGIGGLFRGGVLFGRLQHLRHYRGHGVHSPFVYSIVREVFMRPALTPAARAHFEQLTLCGVKRTIAIEIANLAAHLSVESIEADGVCSATRSMILCTQHCPKELLEQLAAHAAKGGIPFVVIYPQRYSALCAELIQDNQSSSIERKGYTILLNNHLPKQHFKL